MYGTQGVAASTNVPPARQAAVTWTDFGGNLWMFGGTSDINNKITFTARFNDLWRFNRFTQVWTWMSGANTVGNAGSYGTKGVATNTNVPGARYGAVSWIDSAGNLWLFGGRAIDVNGASALLNDLWMYKPSTGLWTWVSGSNIAALGTYGTQGIAATSNVPGARESAVSWTDTTGNLWLFGGFGYDANRLGELNDLWVYKPSTGLWTWVNGSNVSDAAGAYGTKGVAATNNNPGARDSAVSWVDTANNLWLFGGYSYRNGQNIYLNDLWMFKPSAGTWTWVNGSNASNSVSAYGTQGVAAIDNAPGARDAGVSWIDSTGNLWLYGGFGYDTQSVGTLGDLWMYKPSTGLWTWMSGPGTVNTAGIYGTQGIADPTNFPSTRYYPVSWIDSSNTLWLFGGYGPDTVSLGLLNDLWQFH